MSIHPKCTFLDLPIEIREMIYRFRFTKGLDDSGDDQFLDPRFGRPMSGQLLRTCSTVYHEASRFLYQSFSIRFLHDTADVVAFLDKIGASNAKCIHSVVMDEFPLTIMRKCLEVFLDAVTDHIGRMNITSIEVPGLPWPWAPPNEAWAFIWMREMIIFLCDLRHIHAALTKTFGSISDVELGTVHFRLTTDELKMKSEETVFDLEAAKTQFCVPDDDREYTLKDNGRVWKLQRRHHAS